MIAFRKAHPSIGRSTGWGSDVTWYGVDGEPNFTGTSHSFALYLRGKTVGDTDLYVIFNAYWDSLSFTIQAPGHWLRVVDTFLDSPDDIVESQSTGEIVQQIYSVSPRSIVVLVNAQ